MTAGSAVRDALADEVPGLLRYARTIVRDEQLAEDLVQDTMVRAIARADTFRGDASLSTWLHRILHNLAVDHLRRQREVPAEEVPDEVEARWREDSYTVDAAAVVQRAEDREALRDALIRLPVIYRTAVVLHDLEDRTVSEVASIQGIALPAAKQRLRRGRMMLVSALARSAERSVALHGVPMRCWDARRLVSDFLDDDLSAEDRSRVVRHLESCPTCPPLYTSLVGARSAVGALRDPDTVVPTGLARRIQEELELTR